MIDRHVTSIQSAMLEVIADHRARGFDIGRNDVGFYARPKTATVGLSKELRDLERRCRKSILGKISTEGWVTEWAAQPERIKKLWQQTLVETPEGRTLDRNEIAGGFAASGYSLIVPTAEIVMTIIEAELARVAFNPGSTVRKRNEVEAKAIETIKGAYREITGHNGGRSIRHGKLSGNFAGLGRSIDAIFQTKLFAEKDSRRLRQPARDTTAH